MSVSAGAKVKFRIAGKQLILERDGDDLPSFSHADLVRALSKVKKRRFTDFGPPRGKELL